VTLSGAASGPLDEVLRSLAQLASVRERSAWIDSLLAQESAKRAQEADLLEADSTPILPGRIYGELKKRLDRDAVVIGDGGDFVSYAGRLVDSFCPGSFLDPGPYGCLGTGPGYALGAHFAAPDRQKVLLLGDGAAGFSLGDWDTLVRFEVPIPIIIGNNVCWGLEKHPMQQLYGYHVAAELSAEARYDKAMMALGGRGELIEDPAEIGPALDRALDSKGPYVVNVLTDPEHAYPRRSNLA
jgi:acetolactate synthase-1/2/3 large subunit